MEGIIADSTKTTQGVLPLIGTIGSVFALIVGLVALVIGFGASGSASDNTDALAAANAELTRTKTDLATTSQSLESLDSAYNEAQSTLAAAQAAVQATLDSLGDGQSGLKDSLTAAESTLVAAQGTLSNLTTDVTNVDRELTGTQADLSAQSDTISDVDRSLEALKNSFTLTRNDVVANKASVLSLETDTAGLVAANEQAALIDKYTFVEHQFALWARASGDASEATIREMLRNAVNKADDSALTAAFNKMNSSWEAFLNDLSQENLDTVNVDADAFSNLIAEKLNDANLS